MKRSTIIFLACLGYFLVGIVIQLVFRDGQASPWSNLIVMTGDLPNNVTGFLFSIFYLLLTILFWPLHLITILFS